MSDETKPSRYLRYLPAIYQGDPFGSQNDFLGLFLRAFEKILSDRPETATFKLGSTEVPIIGLETILNQIQDYFDPSLTPPQFLQWLAGWVALTLKKGQEWYGDEDLADLAGLVQSGGQLIPLDLGRQTSNRGLIQQIIQLYQKRGTKEGLIAYLNVYLSPLVELNEPVNITIDEFDEYFCVGVSSTVGYSTVVGEGHPYHFEVDMVLPISSREILDRKRQAIIEIIDQEKPAHTYYDLVITVPTMQIGPTEETLVPCYSIVGVNTLLGGIIT